MKKTLLLTIMVLGLVFSFQQYSSASPILSQFSASNGWYDMTSLGYKGHLENGDQGPGGGAQAFDLEYLFTQYDASTETLQFGVQAGFDLVDGEVGVDNSTPGTYGPNGTGWFAGDLAINFGAFDGTTYDYAIKFDFTSPNHYNNDSAHNYNAGLYSADGGVWTPNPSISQSAPFLLTGGTELNVGFTSTSGSGTVDSDGVFAGTTSFYQIVSIDIGALNNILTAEGKDTIDISEGYNLHMTESCGNDEINGIVPEPGTLLLLGLGLFGLATANRKKFFRKS